MFIHGVLEVGKEPWTSDKGVFWPEKLLVPKLGDARILSYKYSEKIKISSDGRQIDASDAGVVYGRLIEDLGDYRTEKESVSTCILSSYSLLSLSD